MTDVEGAESEEQVEAGRDTWVDRYLLIFLRESTLWPILLVIVGHVVAFMVPVLLLSIRERRISAIACLLLLGFFTVNIVRFDVGREGRPAALSILALATWALSGCVAWVAHDTGIF